MHFTLRQSSSQLLDRRNKLEDAKRWSWTTLDNQCSSLELLDSRSSMAVIQWQAIHSESHLNQQEECNMAMETLLRSRQIDLDRNKHRC